MEKEKTVKAEYYGKASMSAQMEDTIIYIWMHPGKDAMCMQRFIIIV